MTESLRIALSGMASNRMRSALTVLGICIGVGAVIMLVAVGNGSSRAVADQISSLGTNSLTVIGSSFSPPGAGGGGGGESFTTEDAEALDDPLAAPDVVAVAPIASAQVTVAVDDLSYEPGSFVGSTPDYLIVNARELSAGTFITDDHVDRRQKVVVIGTTVAENLFVGVNPIGQQIKVNRVDYTVVGLLETGGGAGFQDPDDVVIAPLSTVQTAINGNKDLQSITVSAASSDVVDAAQAEVTAILMDRRDIDDVEEIDFTVLNQASLLETSNEANEVFTVLLGSVAAISLLVGGIGVMNIMLVTVTERTREIGIRKAIGARRIDILTQFLAEATLLALVGGLAGVAAGLVGSHFEIVGIQPVVRWDSVFLAFGVSLLVGLVFGSYPANRAATLRPIDALRYE